VYALWRGFGHQAYVRAITTATTSSGCSYAGSTTTRTRKDHGGFLHFMPTMREAFESFDIEAGRELVHTLF
jgi:hypothetical protein